MIYRSEKVDPDKKTLACGMLKLTMPIYTKELYSKYRFYSSEYKYIIFHIMFSSINTKTGFKSRFS